MDVVHLAITILSLILTAHFVLFAKVSLTFEFRLDKSEFLRLFRKANERIDRAAEFIFSTQIPHYPSIPSLSSLRALDPPGWWNLISETICYLANRNWMISRLLASPQIVPHSSLIYRSKIFKELKTHFRRRRHLEEKIQKINSDPHPVWPDIGIKKLPIFYSSCPKSSQSSF